VVSIIDDDASVRAAANNLVKSLGYTVHVFASAGEFLRSPRLNETACVIADIRMPVMSGLELQSHLRTRGNRVPFIFITALPDATVRARAFEGGASGFLTKPFEEDALINCLNTALDQRPGKRGK
jgi:FixJ family two-component response regulator